MNTNILNNNSDNFDKWINTLGKEKLFEKVDYATDATIKDLITYGNKVNEDYKKAIQALVYSLMFYRNKSTVLAVPLATGSGKSTTMINTVSYMCIDKEFKPYCGTIILKQLIKDVDETVKEINKKHKEQLEELGGFGKVDIAVAYHSQSDFKAINLKANDYPIIVTTHAMFNSMIDNNKIGNLLVWNDNKYNTTLKHDAYYRRRVIIDEEFKGIKFYNINMDTLNLIENASMNLCGEDLFKKFSNEVLTKLKQLFVKSYIMENNNILFTYFEGIEIPEEIKGAFAKCKDQKARESLKAILNMLENGAYIHKEDDIAHKTFTSYKYTNLNCDIFNQILLDATADINTVYKINPNYSVLPLPNVKTYNNTHLHIFDGITGSRQSIIDNFDDGLLNAIVENIINNITEDEEILIVVNKSDLEIQIAEKFEEYECKNKIHYTHYGAITGANKWSQCKKQFMIGIPLVSQESYCLMYYCNSQENDFNKYNNNMRPIKGAKIFIDNNIEELRRGVISSEIIQALNRCQVRKLIDGDTFETHLYMINKDKTIDSMIQKGMPEINISYDWDISYLSLSGNTIVDTELSNEQKLINLLRSIIETSGSIEQLINDKKYIAGKGIKKATLREMLDIKSRTTFTNALNKPLTQQFFKDYNITLVNKSQYILLK